MTVSGSNRNGQAGADVVFHTASPFITSNVSDPEAELYRLGERRGENPREVRGRRAVRGAAARADALHA